MKSGDRYCNEPVELVFELKLIKVDAAIAFGKNLVGGKEAIVNWK